jgi:hypothetical protein
MPNHHSTSRSLPFVSAFSPKERQLAERALGERQAQRKASNASRSQQASQIADRVERQLHSLLGAKTFAALREGLQQERLNLREAMQPPEGLKRDFSKQKAASKRKVDSLLRRLGASPARVKKIISSADAKFESAFLPDHRKVPSGFNLSRNLSKWSKLSPLHRFPSRGEYSNRWRTPTIRIDGSCSSRPSLASSSTRTSSLPTTSPPTG